MKFLKSALAFSDQADLLRKRGLVGDRGLLIERLAAVSYYRLSAYWYTFRVPGDPDDMLRPGTTFDTIWRRYVFDRHLRLHVMDAIERVEIAIRTQVVNRFTLQHGAFGYLDRANRPGLSVDDHRRLLSKIRTEADNSREEFVLHYFRRYSSETDLPFWMASELMTFGTMYTLYRGVKTRIKKEIASAFSIRAPILSSWLRSLNQVRNLCAHHSRLWNREFGVKLLIPEAGASPEWHSPVTIPNNRTFGILTVLNYLLNRVAPQSAWRARLVALFEEYDDIPKRFMGFPADWEDSPIWN